MHKIKIRGKRGLITVRDGMERKENNILEPELSKKVQFLGKKYGNTHSDTDIRVCSDHSIDPDPHGSTPIRTDPRGSAREGADGTREKECRYRNPD
jgi:hypothetical protein